MSRVVIRRKDILKLPGVRSTCFFVPDHPRKIIFESPFESVRNMFVEVEEGKLQGIERKSRLNGKPFYAFLGIPYAKPPIGDLRFRPPVPHGRWGGVLKVATERDQCIQTDLSSGGNFASVGSEDCLYLNVYAPKVSHKMEKKLAVMVYIHGGGFLIESSRGYSPNFLIDYDVILVTFNYRLHVFGFLNTGTPSCPGNAGLKDQLLAIKWVKRNIASFGGDPENITLMGQSAGGTSVHLHMLSPLSKGLFKRAIVQSGHALSAWGFEPDPKSVAYDVGRKAGYEADDLEGLVDHLKDISADRLCRITFECIMDDEKASPSGMSRSQFLPSVENLENDAFLPDAPRNLMDVASPIPSIIGFTDQEGLITLMVLAAQLSGSTNLLPDVISLAVEDDSSLDENERAELIEEINDFYFDSKEPSPENIQDVVDVCTEVCNMKFFDAFDHLVRSDVPSYVYLFAYNGTLNKPVKIDASRPYLKYLEKGAIHGDDLRYLFEPWDDEPIDEVDREVINQFCTLWTNFAKTGNPTFSFPHLDWTPHTDRRPCYLQIGEKFKVIEEKLWGKRFDFWKRWSSEFI